MDRRRYLTLLRTLLPENNPSNARKHDTQWITGGMYADYFLTLIRAPDGGFNLVIIPKDSTVTVRPMEMCGSTCAGTAFVEFDDTHVPVANRVGVEGKGLTYVMSNFNHEVSQSSGVSYTPEMYQLMISMRGFSDYLSSSNRFAVLECVWRTLFRESTTLSSIPGHRFNMIFCTWY